MQLKIVAHRKNEMSKIDKLKKKILNINSVITFDEVVQLLKALGYELDNKGKTSGSRVSFFRKADNAVIMLHKPHPNNELKKYAKKELINNLKERGDL
jgi:hypothetical protein